MAEEQGIRNLAVSLTHEAGMAAAVVVAVCDGERSGSDGQRSGSDGD